jgi:hypothetical protein
MKNPPKPTAGDLEALISDLETQFTEVSVYSPIEKSVGDSSCCTHSCPC